MIDNIIKCSFLTKSSEISEDVIKLGDALKDAHKVVIFDGQYYNYWSLPEMISEINKDHNLDLEKVFKHFRDDMIKIMERRNQETLDFLKHITVPNNAQTPYNDKY